MLSVGFLISPQQRFIFECLWISALCILLGMDFGDNRKVLPALAPGEEGSRPEVKPTDLYFSAKPCVFSVLIHVGGLEMHQQH